MKSRILIVDDEAPVRELLSLYLRKRGFDVATASNSKGALEMLDCCQFQLVILDVNLKAEGGLELLRVVKSKHAQLPVIIFSGNLDADLPATALAAGANGFMHKTNSLQQLFTEVCRHITQ